MSEQTPVDGLARMLLATDGSEHSAPAVDVAIEAAKRCGSELLALTMVISNPEVEAIAPQIVAKAEMRAKDVLDDVARKAKAQGIAIERLVRHGQDPGYQIIRQAEKRKADLIVMGRRGIRGLARMFVGEATVKVCGQAPCSVLVVPRGGRMPCKRILVATDGSRYSDAATAMAERLSRRCALPVTVLSVTVPSHSDARRQVASSAVAHAAEALIRSGILVDARVVEAAQPDVGIIDTAKAVDADLVIVGSHGRTGLIEKVLIGSVSERVLGSADCPVLVAKSG